MAWFLTLIRLEVVVHILGGVAYITTRVQAGGAGPTFHHTDGISPLPASIGIREYRPPEFT
jgi:hypothetical protein